MRKSNFHRGVHPEGHKELSAQCPLTPYLPKGDMVFPLGQHIGKPAAPVVKKGDAVLAGQLIAEASGPVSANIVSSCSGTVKTVTNTAITITNDGAFTLAEGVGEKTDLASLSHDEILEKVKKAGIVGLGGAGFPTHIKLTPQNPEAIDYIIANGAECEPYITCDDRLMQEKPEEIIGGLKVILKLFPDAQAVIAIEQNKPAAIEAMKKAAEGEEKITVMPIETRYPQGGERNMIYTVTGRMLAARALPATLGCIVDNVGTIAAVYKAVCLNTPLMEKGFTVTGDAVANPGNYMVKIGTNLAELVEAAGGFRTEPKKLILGGPMMGAAQADLNFPIVKANNAITCMAEDPVEEAWQKMTACIRCGKCTKACPIGLYPQMMAEAANKKDYDRYEKLYGLQCMSCGSCSYICPAKRPLTELFKVTKAGFIAWKTREEGK